MHGTTEERACDVRGRIAWAEHPLLSDLKVIVTQDQIDALVSFEFYVGSRTVAQPTVLTHVNAGQFEAAAGTMLLYGDPDGRVLDDLERRRKEEAALLYSPIALAQSRQAS